MAGPVTHPGAGEDGTAMPPAALSSPGRFIAAKSSRVRVKRLFTWYTDDFGVRVTEDGEVKKIPANHARGRYYNPMAHKRNWGRKPRTRLRRAA